MYNIQSKAAVTSINEEIATYGVSDVDNVHLLTAVLNVGSVAIWQLQSLFHTTTLQVAQNHHITILSLQRV